ncbi:MAG: hypothetical protein QOK39_2353 [Acidimicrobiaceae bacterium]|nr:hypothetical protein [Acidimicrobiaceae bacterium]
MRFRFEHLPGPSADVARPALEVAILGSDDTVTCLCLVDTGSLHNRFGIWVADLAGVDLTGAAQQTIGDRRHHGQRTDRHGDAPARRVPLGGTRVGLPSMAVRLPASWPTRFLPLVHRQHRRRQRNTRHRRQHPVVPDHRRTSAPELRYRIAPNRRVRPSRVGHPSNSQSSISSRATGRPSRLLASRAQQARSSQFCS